MILKEILEILNTIDTKVSDKELEEKMEAV